MVPTSVDWRVTDGPAIGLDPAFVLSDIEGLANFWITGSMSRRISARVAARTPLRVESIGIPLTDLQGLLTIYDEHPDRSNAGLCAGHFDSVDLTHHRGGLAIHPPGGFAIHLYLPEGQFERLLPLLAARSTARLQIEVDRTLDQALSEEESLFWNDRVSPVVLFEEFRISVP